jgi:hypothetical protein
MEIKTLIYLIHAIYLSSGIVEIQPEKNSISITVKVFADDLQSVLINRFENKEIQLEAIPDNYIQTYFNDHFVLTSSHQKQLPLILAKKEMIGELYVLDFNILTGKKMGQKIQMKADYFIELFPGQINVLKVKWSTKHQFLRFTKNQSVQTIDF